MHRKTGWTPSIVPTDNDETVYLVAADFGRLGRAWPEADYEATDLETVIQDLLSGQYNNPIRVVAFNKERWSEDVGACHLPVAVPTTPSGPARPPCLGPFRFSIQEPNGANAAAVMAHEKKTQLRRA
jgi:hypothetical protein